jgi:hypothetical protein
MCSFCAHLHPLIKKILQLDLFQSHENVHRFIYVARYIYFLDVCRFVVKHQSIEVLQHLTCLYLFWI